MKKIEKSGKENLILPDSKPVKLSENGIKKSKKGGFTLIELVVVIAVIAILVGISTASMVSVSRRKATRAGKLIDSELTLFASNAFSKDGAWRLEFRLDPNDDCYVLTQQYNTDESLAADQWVDYSEIRLGSDVDISFGGDEYDEDNSGGTFFVSLSREKGNYLTEGFFCEKIFVHSAAKVVTIDLSSQSGGHRVID